MKLNIISHNFRGLNDPESVTKGKKFINSIIPKIDIVMIQDNKVRGRLLDSLSTNLMSGCASWIFPVEPREKSWLNPNVVGKGGWVFFEVINILG